MGEHKRWQELCIAALSPGEVFLVLDGAEPEVDLQLGLDLEAAGARPPATRRLQ